MTDTSSFGYRESSRTLGEPVELYLFKGADPVLESLIRSVALAPGLGEFAMGTTPVYKPWPAPPVTKPPTPPKENGYLNSLNRYARNPATDFVAAVDDITAIANDIEHVTLVVCWHGDNLAAGDCTIRPKVTAAAQTTVPYEWNVGGLTRVNAQMISTVVHGAPSDRSLFEAIVELKNRGLRVTVYPSIFMDIPAENVLVDPYTGETGQPVTPWRGLITCNPAPGVDGTADKTSAAADQVALFFGEAESGHFGWNATDKHVTYTGPTLEWSYRRFILHLATIAHAANADTMLIGSELAGLTKVRSDADTFPAVDQLVALAADVNTILGAGKRISYAADWSEYHSYRPNDGSGDVFFNLDPLWSSSDIDFIGIDPFFPISDWRNTSTHLDRAAGYTSGHDLRYLMANIQGGEFYTWTYVDADDRDDQIRTPIVDPLGTEENPGKPWVYRQKDIQAWWTYQHFNRPAGMESETPTAWAAQSKPIVFTLLAAPAVDRAALQPCYLNSVLDPAAPLPPYSNGGRDDAIQRAIIESWLTYWQPERGRNPVSNMYADYMIDWAATAVGEFDIRPYPVYRKRSDIWFDGVLWSTGRALNGRIFAGRDFDAGPLGPYAYTDAESPIVKNGITYLPAAISRGPISSSGSLDKTLLEVTMAQGKEIGNLFIAYPPNQVINLIIFQGHVGADPNALNTFPAVWTGRVLGAQHPPNEVKFSCEPISTSIRRPGLRRNYQLPCAHVLYGSSCRASKKRATVERIVQALGNNRITLSEGWSEPMAAAKYRGGLVEWSRDDGARETRSILQVDSGVVLRLSGPTRGLVVGQTVSVILGCNHTMPDCRDIHANILNFGGQPWIPLVNPLGFSSQY